LDVGLYQYKTLFRRRNFLKSIPLKKEADIFATLVRDGLSDYRTIILVGHSMGGLLCKATICSLINKNDKPSLARIGGLFLMATPQLGSARVPNIFGFCSHDFWALRQHGELVSEINNTFEDHLYLDENINAFDKAIIPTWAVVAASDLWVDPLSAGIGLVATRKKLVHGSHTTVVKPNTTDDDVYRWLCNKISTCLHRFKYDVYISTAMAGLESEDHYRRYRNATLGLEKCLIERCNFRSIFYAGRGIETKSEFEAKSISLKENLQVLRESRYFILFYPHRVVSSVLFEAGLALALGKPSAYFVHKRSNLPFLMANAGEASLHAEIKIYECEGIDSILNHVQRHGEKLWGEGKKE